MISDGVVLPEPNNGFMLRQKVMHVLTEADRVEKSCESLKNNDPVLFGKYMNASHKSCDENYGHSTPELNTLVSIMRTTGALGARLTGAGFGGCAIALVRDEEVESIKEQICEHYYRKYIAEHHPSLLKKHTLDETIFFSVKPSQGAEITPL
jgi:N-acetylgalactosamine kinase